MKNGERHWIEGSIRGIADDVLRDVYVRGKHRDVIPPMTVLRNVHKPGRAKVDPLRGRYASPEGDPGLIVEYEPDPELRDTEQVPLLEEGGVDAFFEREVLPHVPDARIHEAKTQIGYEISFTRHAHSAADAGGDRGRSWGPPGRGRRLA